MPGTAWQHPGLFSTCTGCTEFGFVASEAHIIIIATPSHHGYRVCALQASIHSISFFQTPVLPSVTDALSCAIK